MPYASLSLLQGIISALCLPVTSHCCKASSVPYASLLQDSLLQAPLPAYLASVLCVIIAFIQRCVGLCFIPVMVWSGLCFIPRRSGLVWSGLVCVLYPTRLWRGPHIYRRYGDPRPQNYVVPISTGCPKLYDTGVTGNLDARKFGSCVKIS